MECPKCGSPRLSTNRDAEAIKPGHVVCRDCGCGFSIDDVLYPRPTIYRSEVVPAGEAWAIIADGTVHKFKF